MPPQFALGGEFYDQSSGTGRFYKFLNMVDPRTLLPGLLLSMPFEEAQSLLNAYRDNQRIETTQERLWLAQKIVSATIHPQTGVGIS